MAKKSVKTIGVVNLRARKKVSKFFLVVFLCIVFLSLVMGLLVNPIMIKSARSKIDSLSNSKMNQSVQRVMNGTVTYDDLITIVTDGAGKISLLQANTVLINSLSQDIVTSCYDLLAPEISKPLEIPLGAFFGLPVFSGLGPILKIKIIPFEKVHCRFLSKFVSAGINQTQHKIYIELETDVNVVMPTSKLMVESKIEVLVCESLIIGEIPDTYLMAESKGDLLNMVG